MNKKLYFNSIDDQKFGVKNELLFNYLTKKKVWKISWDFHIFWLHSFTPRHPIYKHSSVLKVKRFSDEVDLPQKYKLIFLLCFCWNFLICFDLQKKKKESKFWNINFRIFVRIHIIKNYFVLIDCNSTNQSISDWNVRFKQSLSLLDLCHILWST